MHGFHYSPIVTERNIAADAVIQYDLGVNPLSCILLNLRPLNDTGTLADWNNGYRIAQAMNRVSVILEGTAIASLRGEDLCALNFLRWGMLPYIKGSNADNANNERRTVTIPLFFGRYPFSKTSALPATGKGRLQLEIDFDIADTGYDTLNFSVDALELPGAKPKEFEKKVQQTFTFAATGNQDVFIPVGNKIRGFMLWGTTPYGGASPAPSWGSVTVLKDNEEAGFRSMDWEVLQMLQQLWGRPGLNPTEDDHAHNTTVDGNAQTAVETLGGGGHDLTGTTPATYSKYAFLDFDPTGDDAYVLDTSDAKQLVLRAAVETADACRCVPIEVIGV